MIFDVASDMNAIQLPLCHSLHRSGFCSTNEN